MGRKNGNSNDTLSSTTQHRPPTPSDRPGGDALVRYAESSMRTGFGLKLLHRFLNVPFLTLQRGCLLTQMETNQRETQATNQELDLYEESDEANYDV